MKKNNKMIRSLSCLIAVIMLLSMMVGMMVTTAYAENENQAVTAASKGVLQFNVVYNTEGNKQISIVTGTCFLINEDTIVTCAHCVDITDEMIEWVAAKWEITPELARARLSYTVTIAHDVMVDAAVEKMSSDVDWAILRLERKLNSREVLKVRRAAGSVEMLESVYAIGFPQQTAWLQTVSTFDSSDVTITGGEVNKLTAYSNLNSGVSTDYILSSVVLSDGNSGGPLVDKNGAVVGICQGSVGEYYYAVTVDYVLDICDDLGIEYTSADGSAVDPEPPASETSGSNGGEVEPTEPIGEPTEEADNSDLLDAIEKAEAKSADDYTEDSYAALSDALDAAYEAKLSNDQDKIDAAVEDLEKAMDGLEEAEESNSVLIIAVAAGAVILLIIIIVVIVASSGKKKNAKAAAAAPRAPMNQAQRPVGAPATGFAPGRMETVPQSRPATTPVMTDAGETSLLTQSQNAGETTLLAKNINGGSLMRVRTSEQVTINAEEFVIGRERKRVNYCVSDNTSISRVHAKLVVRNGVTYLVDLNAANGTFLNSTKASAHQEYTLKDGDKIMLADESFLFKA